MLALGTSRFVPYSILHQRYHRQTDHANKTRPDLRLDIELIITNNITGTSRDPIFRFRERTRWDQPPAENLTSRIFYDAYHDAPSPQLNYNGKRSQDPNHNCTQDVRAATPTTTTPPSATKNAYPCPNCGADHRATECPDPKCYVYQTTLPSAAARQAHYLANHKHESKRERFEPTPTRNHYTPPTSPFLSCSAEDMTNNQSPYDSGHESSYSHASGPGHPPSSRRNSDIDEQVDRYIREQRVATLIFYTPIATTLTLPQSHDTQQRDRHIALSHRLLAALPHSITHDPVLLNIARACIQDIAHSNPANNATYTNLPPSFRDIIFPTAFSYLHITDPLIPSPNPYIDEANDDPPPHWCTRQR